MTLTAISLHPITAGQAAQYKASIACGVGYDGAYYTDEGLHKYIPAVVIMSPYIKNRIYRNRQAFHCLILA
jgi:hypothetical protein